MIKREFYLKKLRSLKDSDEIKIITGVRRCGKTTLIKQFIDELKDNGVGEENILYFSFESPEYREIDDADKLDEIVYGLTKNIEGKIYLFFDELYKIKNWEKSLNFYRIDLDSDIYIIDSNVKIVSEEFKNLLRERYSTLDILPFSFNEVRQHHLAKNSLSSISKEDELELFEDYLTYGGLPSLLNYGGAEKLEILSDLYTSIVFNDIIYKSNIRKYDLLEKLMEYMVLSIGEALSGSAISKAIRKKRSASTASIITLLENVCDGLMLYNIRRENVSEEIKLKYSNKYYLVDLGFYYLFYGKSDETKSRLIENVVFLELLRRGYEITTGEVSDLNVHFICRKNGETIYVHVAESISNFEVREKEMLPLNSITNIGPKYILSLDDDDFSTEKIKHLNLIDFLKSDEI